MTHDLTSHLDKNLRLRAGANTDTFRNLDRYKLNARPSRREAADRVYRPPQGLKLPDYASNGQWRAPIRNQGEEGACTGFTGRNAMAFMRGRNLQPYVEFSPQHLYHNELMLENGTAEYDTGCSIKTIPRALAEFGIAEEAMWPYEHKRFHTKITPKVAEHALQYRITDYQRVTSLYDLMYAIAIDKLCVLIGINCYEGITSEAVAQNGIVPLPRPGESANGGHALLCDKYDATHNIAPFLIFGGPNSWGDDWGSANQAPSAAGDRRGLYYLPQAFVEDPDCLSDIWVLYGKH